jgi:hypothetical protein
VVDYRLVLVAGDDDFRKHLQLNACSRQLAAQPHFRKGGLTGSDFNYGRSTPSKALSGTTQRSRAAPGIRGAVSA